MDRIYDNGTSDIVTMFVGEEVEKTPAYKTRTLFVVGVHPIETIAKYFREEKCEHIYLGANMSFETSNRWEVMVTECLKLDTWVTLDYDIKHHEWVLEAGFNEYDRFISMISAKLPYIDQLNYNACLKVDDRDFRATNTGVWVHPVHSLQERSMYTDWSKYTKDKPLL
jgi:hypothetical protein